LFFSNQNITPAVAKVAQSASHKTKVLWMTVIVCRGFLKQFSTTTKELSEISDRKFIVISVLSELQENEQLID